MSDQRPDKDQLEQTPPPPVSLADSTEEEAEHYDDAIIGRAFRWSLVVLVLVAVATGGGLYWVKHRPVKLATRLTPLSSPVVPAKLIAEIPVARFTDATAAAGITFSHNNGAYGDKLLPETMGGGVAFFDYDNDGATDILFVNSTYWPGHIPDGQKPTCPALYHNDGTGHFTDVTAGSGLDVSLYGMGAAVGDYDNDGLVDVLHLRRPW